MARKKDDSYQSSMIEHPSLGGKIADCILIIICILVAFCSIIPMWHELMASLSEPKELLKHEGLVAWPVGNVTFEGYKRIFSDSSIILGFINTMIYVIGGTGLGYVLSVLGGFCFSRKTKLSPILIAICTFTMLFSGGTVPTYMVVRNLGMVNTRWSLIIPACTSAMNAIMMMNAFMQVPHEYEEAAVMDGCGPIRMLFQVLLPQAKTMGMVLILQTAIAQYNAWFDASIYVTNKKSCWPLQLWIKQMVADNESFLLSANPDYNRYLIQFAVVIATTLPILIALPFFQDKLEKGVIAGGIKG